MLFDSFASGPARDASIELLNTTAHFVATVASRYPSIAPAREAMLAPHGYTVAELLIDMTAELVQQVAALYEHPRSERGAEFIAAARAAKLHAFVARKTIEQGVASTTNGGPILFDPAPSQEAA